MVLIFFVKLYKVGAPAPYTYYKLHMIFGVLLRIKHCIKIYGIKLQLMTAAVNKVLNEKSDRLYAVLVGEYALVKFKIFAE